MASPWYVEAFRAGYLEVYAHRDDAAAVAEVDFALTLFGANPRVLDAGCGAGRHARAFAARGAAVVGVDLSADLLHVAARAAGGPRYLRADLRDLPFRDGVFDAVASFFTSFGYFDEQGNARHLYGLRRVLRAHGRLLLDFLNAEHVRAGLVPRSARTHAGHTVVEERALRAGRVEKDVTVVLPAGGRRGWRESVRLYTRAELEGLLRAASFRVVAAHGDLRGAPFTPRAPRCVLLAEAV